MRPLALPLLVAVALCPLGALAQASPTDSAVTAALESRFEQWITAYERADAAGVAALFTEDGIYAANTGELLRGRQGIRTGIEGWIAKRPAGISLELERETIRIRHVAGVAHALLRFTIRAVEPNCLVDAGHALVIWHEQPDGAWMIDTQLVNKDPGPPPNACSSR